MKRMTRNAIEPGLLQVFRWFAAGRLLWLLLTLCGQLAAREPLMLRYPLLGILETTFLLAYLSWPWLQRRLGAFYLPLALVVASAAPILEQSLSVGLRLRAGMRGAEATADAWQLILVLFLPLILVSWQYNFRAMLAFTGGTALLEFFLIVLLALAARFRPGSVLVLIVVRTLVFLLVGTVVTRLMDAQRSQRRALAEANRRLTHYASTLEQLAVSRERNRLARELHDTLAHTLSGLAVQLEALKTVWDPAPLEARRMLQEALDNTREGLTETRQAIQALRASPLEDLGLSFALESLAERFAARHGLALELAIAPVAGLRPETEQCVYRVAQEALENAGRHAQATKIGMRLTQANGTLSLELSDDGRGFDPEKVDPTRRFGLQGMRERAQLVGARLDVASRPGAGTRVRLTVEENHDPRADL